jgi:hypothetical protein
MMDNVQEQKKKYQYTSSQTFRSYSRTSFAAVRRNVPIHSYAMKMKAVSFS